MKIVIKCFIFFLLVSCDSVTDKDINNIENLLGTTLPADYVLESDHPFSTAYYYIVIDITFNERDFKQLLDKVDTTKFEKINNYFYREINEGDDEGDIVNHQGLIIFIDKNKITYSEKR